ncbi:unnamed protein product [Pylaiella littoralis]
MSESDGCGSNNGSRKRAPSTGGDRSSPSPPRNASVSFVSGAAAAVAAVGSVAHTPTLAPAPAPAPTPGPSSKKKQKKGPRGSTTGAQAFIPPGVVISRSAEDCAPQLSLSKDQLTITGNKGFRMARATKGVSNGTWYWECTVLRPVTKDGHCRLGWSLPTGSLQGPVGYDKSSYAYRDTAGSKVHESLRTDNYGEPWGTGDVIGFLIKLKSPSSDDAIDAVGAVSDSARLSVSAAAAAAAAASLAAGQSPSEQAATAVAATAEESGVHAFNEIRFFKNGRDQGVAFSGIKPGTYFPAVSLYMGGSVRVNFGPEFVYPPPRSHSWKPVAALRPFSKDEMKTQRKETKRERAARGLETATRQIGGAPPLPGLSGTSRNNGTNSNNGGGNDDASSRSASPPPPPSPATSASAAGASSPAVPATKDTSKSGSGGGSGGGDGGSSSSSSSSSHGDREEMGQDADRQGREGRGSEGRASPSRGRGDDGGDNRHQQQQHHQQQQPGAFAFASAAAATASGSSRKKGEEEEEEKSKGSASASASASAAAPASSSSSSSSRASSPAP